MTDTLIVAELQAVDPSLIQLRLPSELRCAAMRRFEEDDLAAWHGPRQRMSQAWTSGADASGGECLRAAPMDERDIAARRAPFGGKFYGLP